MLRARNEADAWRCSILLGDDTLRHTLAENCHRWGRNTAWPDLALEYLDAFRCAMGARMVAAR